MNDFEALLGAPFLSYQHKYAGKNGRISPVWLKILNDFTSARRLLLLFEETFDYIFLFYF